MTRLSRPGSMIPSLMVSVVVVSALLSGPVLAAEPQAEPAASSTIAKPATPPRKPLDLRPPNVTHLFTSEQLNKILAASFRENIEEVEVEGEREYLPSSPTVWPGIAAPFWAVLNPTQSWRIFAPLPPDQTRGLQYVRANASDAYVLEPAGLARPDAQKMTQ